MKIKEIQEKIINQFGVYCKKNDIRIDKDFIFAKLIEEVWELSQAILIHNKQCRKEKIVSEKISKYELEREFGDVAGMLFILAKENDIDIEKAIENKWIYDVKAQNKPE